MQKQTAAARNIFAFLFSFYTTHTARKEQTVESIKIVEFFFRYLVRKMLDNMQREFSLGDATVKKLYSHNIKLWV
jgi:hypothetical protein